MFDLSLVSDFYYKYLEDLELCCIFGINGFCIFIVWLWIFFLGVGKFDLFGV